MKFFPVLIILVMSLLGCTSVPKEIVHPKQIINCTKLTQCYEASELVKNIGTSTVALVLRVKGQARVYCTGVWVGDNTILTANHCVESVAKITGYNGYDPESSDDINVAGFKVFYLLEREVSNVYQEPTGTHLGTVMFVDARHDLALIKADDSLIPYHTSAKLAEVSPGIGEKLYFVGQGGGLYWTYLQGNVSAYRDKLPAEDTAGPYMQVQAPLFFGHSGGGAFNENGELVGIAIAIPQIPNTGFCVYLGTIKKFFKDHETFMTEKKLLLKK